MHTVYCKEIHIFHLGEKYILKYFGETNNLTSRKHHYSVNCKKNTTFIQCSIKDILFKNSIKFQEFPIKIIKNNIQTRDDSHLEELKIVLEERKKKKSNEIIFGSLFTFSSYKIRYEKNPIQFLLNFGYNVSDILESLSEDDLIEFHSVLKDKSKSKEELMSFLMKNFQEEEQIGDMSLESICLGYGGFCYRCKEGRHLQRLCKNF
jgi:hypothetical protein